MKNKLLKLYSRVLACGQHNKKTSESSDSIQLDLKDLDLTEEQEELSKFMNDMGYSYEDKLKTEKNYYESIKYTLLHKLDEIDFYFDENKDETRKCIAINEDCISAVHLVLRKGVSKLNVFMRSADLVKTFPVDILNLSKIIKEIGHNNAKINIFISCAHIYDVDREKVLRILEQEGMYI